MTDISALLESRILILDGAMGTMIQAHNLHERDFRHSSFTSVLNLYGDNDLLVISRPDIIAGIHEAFLAAGADIISTNTFNATGISQLDYGMEAHAVDINIAAARVARAAADKFSTPDKPRFVAGALGPTSRTASISPKVEDAAFRNVTFDELVETYTEQATALLTGGVDLLLLETIFDTLNAKAAHLYALSKMASEAISCYPNAGLPNAFGEYDDTPEYMAQVMADFARAGLLNIVGGCCGSTPAHIKAIADAVRGIAPRAIGKGQKAKGKGSRSSQDLDLPFALRLSPAFSGLEPFVILPETNFVNVGERSNITGSPKFSKAILEGDFEGALKIARQQVEAGAQIIDINMDEGLLDSESTMTKFLNLVAGEPEIARVPIMIDSSKWSVLEAGLKCVQGKAIVNSLSLKDGEAEFKRRAGLVRRYGAAAVVMAFDETGQADTRARKVAIHFLKGDPLPLKFGEFAFQLRDAVLRLTQVLEQLVNLRRGLGLQLALFGQFHAEGLCERLRCVTAIPPGPQSQYQACQCNHQYRDAHTGKERGCLRV